MPSRFANRRHGRSCTSTSWKTNPPPWMCTARPGSAPAGRNSRTRTPSASRSTTSATSSGGSCSAASLLASRAAGTSYPSVHSGVSPAAASTAARASGNRLTVSGSEGVHRHGKRRGDPEVHARVGDAHGVAVADAGLPLDAEQRLTLGGRVVEVDRQERDVGEPAHDRHELAPLPARPGVAGPLDVEGGPQQARAEVLAEEAERLVRLVEDVISGVEVHHLACLEAEDLLGAGLVGVEGDLLLERQPLLLSEPQRLSGLAVGACRRAARSGWWSWRTSA